MPHHMAQAHPGVSHDYAGCSEEEKTKVLQAFDNFQAPLPPKAKLAAPPALPNVLRALFFGPNQGSSSSGSSSSSNSNTNASSCTSASSSSSAPSGVSDYVLEVLQCSKAITSYGRSQCVLLALSLSVCALRGAWRKHAGFGSTKGVGGCPPPPAAPKTVAHPSGSHIGWRRPP